MGTNVTRTIYLCGSINGCTDAECTDWRTYAKGRLDGAVLDPMSRDFRGVEGQNIAAIVEGDKVDIDHCDVLLVYYSKPSVGTSMEILYAWERGKEIIIVNKSTESVSPWLSYHSSALFADLDSAISYINGRR